MSDSPYIAYGFPSEPGETRYIPAKKGKYRPATRDEIQAYMNLEEIMLDAAVKAKCCYMHEDGKSFMIDNMERFQDIMMAKYLREL